MKKFNKTVIKFLPIFLTIVFIFNISFSLIVSAEIMNEKVDNHETIFENKKARIDFTDSNDTGTVKINTVVEFDQRVKVIIAKNEKNSATYSYDLKNDKTIEAYPLQMGDGEYIIKILVQVVDKKYSVKLTGTYNVKLSDAKAPFLNPSQYVNFDEDSLIVKIAKDLTKNCETDLQKIEEIYKFIIYNIEYDMHKAATVQSGYLPSADEIVDTGKGICFDYAVVFAAMLRSLNIPAKLVIGYIQPNNEYHAWNEFALRDNDGQFEIYNMTFDGKKFERVDTTLHSSNLNASKKVFEFIRDCENYDKVRVY